MLVHRPKLVIRQVMRARPGDLQIRARPVRRPVHAHDDGDHSLGPGPHQRHEVQRRRRAVAGHPQRPPDRRNPHHPAGTAGRQRLAAGRREHGGQHALPAIPTQQDPRPGPDGRIKISREADEVILIERAGRNEDPPSPDDLPLRAFRGGERRHTPIRPAVRPGRGIQATQLITRPPQLGLGQQPQVGLGPLVAHPPSLHLASATTGNVGPVRTSPSQGSWPAA
jgi:hypothetical protein